jgi:putative spermidine/putrescine transport system permease protein
MPPSPAVRPERRATNRREVAGAISLLGPATLLMLVMLVAPLAIMARYSVNKFDPSLMMIAAVTPANYLRFFADPFYWSILVVTFRVSVIVTAACLLIALPMAWRLARTQSRWKSLMVVFLVLPLFIGSIVRTAGWLILFSRGGMLDQVTRLVGWPGVDLMYTEFAVTVGIIAINLPYTVLILQSVFEGIDTRLDDAAASMGASPTRAFWRIIFPLALPGVIIAAALSFILTMNAFPTPVLLGGPRFQMMSPLLYFAFSSDNNWPFAAAIAFILMGVTHGLTGLATIAVPRRYRTGRHLK